MVWAALSIPSCFCVTRALVKATLATLLVTCILPATEQDAGIPALVPPASPEHLPAACILTSAKGLQPRPQELSRAQLSCLAQLLAARDLPDDFSRYPPDLLLFFDLAKVDSGTCGDFYARVSHGNLELLPKGSSQRKELLRGALSCLGVRSRQLSPEQLRSLGALVCDMEPETIPASAPAVLENLKLCPVLTGAQKDALNAVLLGGDTAYGDPSSWDLWTLQSLGPLVLALNQTTLSLVAQEAREALGRSITATPSPQGPAKPLRLLGDFAAALAPSHPRLKRGTERCPSTPITASTISNTFIIIDYTSEEFNLCLSNEVLKANLRALLEQPFSSDYIGVIKSRMAQMYPSGMPEEQLQHLGPLSRLYSVEEISKWQVTSNDTLQILLNPSDGRWSFAQVQQLIRRYLELGGIPTAPLIQKMGGGIQLCRLKEKQIQQISPEAIRTLGKVDISSCSQAQKDQLYRAAREAFAGQTGSPRAYYCHIQPFLGGAPVQDLKELAEAEDAIDMDMATFLALNPKELQKLSIRDVKKLLGVNLPQLKEAEKNPVVMGWVKRQSQRELDCILGIGLQGGMAEPSPPGTSPPPEPSTLAGITPSASSALGLPDATPTKPSVPSLSSVPSPALTHGAPTTTTSTTPVGTTPTTSTPLLSTTTPAPGGSTHPAPTLSTHNPPSTLVPESPSTPAAPTDRNLPSQKPTLIPSSSHQSIIPATRTTPFPCKTSAPPAFPGPSPSEATKQPPRGMTKPPTPTPKGHPNLQPPAGAGSRFSSCLLQVLLAALGSSLLRGML
ncbi:mesothelin-like protein [Calypte anna]|uniref:mesothelin-like protein n=1 Tax=Calypte anna TaxID=9244 RepID=UPI0011C4560F|nr:mesothelin-like protein [Calypte anna]XP_030315715.1 mesothelin-like protein [Calypte anna]